MKTHKYSLHLVTANKCEVILENETPQKIRNVAKNIKPKFGRKIVILRDQKELLGGASALDAELYQTWLEEHQPELKSS